MESPFKTKITAFEQKDFLVDTSENHDCLVKGQMYGKYKSS
jgi:hypothetical protein